MKCKDCKYWGSKTFSRFSNGRERFYNLGECHMPIDVDGEGYEDVSYQGAGLDYSECSFITGPEFGCTKFEAKKTHEEA